MFIKSLIAIAAVSSVLAIAAPAQAGVKVYLGGGFDSGYAYDGYNGYGNEGYGYEPDNFYSHPRPRYESYGISCEDGREQVRDAGYRKVRALNCNGKRYTYKARRHGDSFIVKVSRRSGDIISIEQVY